MAENIDVFEGSYTDYENFILGPIWHDMRAELLLLQQEITASLKTVEGNELYRYQGRAQVIDEMLKWPSSMMEIIESDLEREQIRNG